MRRLTIRYGDAPSQYGHLYLPDHPSTGSVPLVVLVHGGYWTTEFGLIIETAIARDLAGRGAVVWNVEYRRVGEPGGGWPRTGLDVVAALRALDGPVRAALSAELAGVIAWDRIDVVGHSAGGQLALWAVSRLAADDARSQFTVATVVAQSAALDLEAAGVAGRPSVRALLGVNVHTAPQRYRDASPVCLPVLAAHVVVLHGALDTSIPPSVSRDYVDRVGARGQSVEYVEVPGEGHDAFVTPDSLAHRATVRALGL
ncbi:alpha/beta hydrolase family protein [Williamsia sterculiae]|uniref:Alpha/beta hydrolase fold n=1 Tax=Williamsia sterculiae TaxID=1344003 RepID=A0A1N7G6Q0_9NOCA|nr:alpha/beta hydrolase fold domain-containing protein [Williamsia sterculiae]SIS08259.1 alpha/beta hydrolase fold [Williamsia sterculiae]